MSTAEREMSFADNALKGGRVQASALSGITADIASVRAGRASGADLPGIQSCNQEKYGEELANNQANRFDRKNRQDREELSQLIKKAYDPDHRGSSFDKELAAYREFELINEVLAIPFALNAFQAVNLSADELPMIIRPRARQHFTVRYIGQDGGARQEQWRHTKQVEFLDMKLISTPKVEYPIMDLRQGNVDEFDRIQETMLWDMEMMIDGEALASLNANIATSGLRSLLSLSSTIQTSAIPDTNYLDLTNASYGTPGTWTLPKLKALLVHISRFGQGIQMDGGGGLTISNIQYSPENLQDWWDFVDLVSGFNSSTLEQNPKNVVPTEVRKQIFNTGMMNSAWGFNWTSQVNAQIPKGRMYVFTNQPVGWFFTKSDFDRMIKWEGPDQVEQNIAQVLWQRAITFAQVDLWKHRYVVIDF